MEQLREYMGRIVLFKRSAWTTAKHGKLCRFSDNKKYIEIIVEGYSLWYEVEDLFVVDTAEKEC